MAPAIERIFLKTKLKNRSKGKRNNEKGYSKYK